MGNAYGRPRPKKAKKAKKEHWFARLTVDELKQICKAAKFPVSGAKTVLIDRLVENEFTRQFALECPHYGCNVESLKNMCKERNLIQSGTKFSLVVRLVEHRYGSAPEATAAATKRPAPPVDPNAPPKKPKAPSRPSLEKIYDKVLKKIESVDQKKYQSYHGQKTHSPVVYSCISKTLATECVEKGFIVTDPLFALEIAKSALVCLNDNFFTILRPGYDDCDDIQDFCTTLENIVKAAKPLMDEDLKNETVEWIETLDNTLSPYGLGESFNYSSSKDNTRYLVRVVNILKDVKEKAAEEPEVKEDAVKKVSEGKEIAKESSEAGVSMKDALVLLSPEPVSGL